MRKRDGQTDRDLLSLSLLLKRLLQPELGQAEARSIELNSSLSHGWQGPNYLVHHLLPPRVQISRKLESGTESGFEPRHPIMGCGHTSVLATMPNSYAFISFQWSRANKVLNSYLKRTLLALLTRNLLKWEHFLNHGHSTLASELSYFFLSPVNHLRMAGAPSGGMPCPVCSTQPG